MPEPERIIQDGIIHNSHPEYLLGRRKQGTLFLQCYTNANAMMRVCNLNPRQLHNHMLNSTVR